MSGVVRVSVLGPVQLATADGTPVALPGIRGRALVVSLVLARGKVVSTASLIEDIWQDEPPQGAKAALQTLVSRVRSLGGDDLIISSPGGYRLGIPVDAVDLWASGAASRGEPGADLAELDLGERLAHAAWERRSEALETEIEAALEVADAQAALEAAEKLTAQSPSSESAELLLLRALAASGRQADALRHFEQFRERLSDELGVDPGDALNDFHTALLRGTAPGLAASQAVNQPEAVPTPSASDKPTTPSSLSTTTSSHCVESPKGAESHDTTSSPGMRTAPDDTSSPGATNTTGTLVWEPSNSTQPEPASSGSAATTSTTPLSRTPQNVAAPTSVDAAFPTPTPGHHIAIGLKSAATPLIGRDHDLAMLGKLLATARLTTILGAGGLGKTRMAQELAARFSQALPLTVVVELAGVNDPAEVPVAVALALGVGDATTPRLSLSDPIVMHNLNERIIATFDNRAALLILDNCEHLIDAVAEFCDHLLEASAGLRILTTSRSPLQIAAEQVYPLGSLSSRNENFGTGHDQATGWASAAATIPASTDLATRPNGNSARSGLHTPAPTFPTTGPSTSSATPSTASGTSTTASPYGSDEESNAGPAVQLFLERARSARPGAKLPLAAVARLCDHLDGLPLAIELAAARVRTMGLDEIEHRLDNRFTLLRGGNRSAPERHRTLMAVIDWSWNLLTASQRQLLRRLSRFADGFSADAAATFAEDSLTALDDLDALVTQSLVTLSEDAATGSARYRMLETVREFASLALEEAGESEVALNAMAAWGRTISRRLQQQVESPEQLAAIFELGLEYDNLVAVLRTAVERKDAETALTIYPTLAWYLVMRNQLNELFGFSRSVIDLVELVADPSDSATASASSGEENGTSSGQRRNESSNDHYLTLAVTMLLVYSIMTAIPNPRAKRTAVDRDGLRRVIRFRKILESRPEAPGRAGAIQRFVLARPFPEGGMAILPELAESPDLHQATLGQLMGAMTSENWGEPFEALRLAKSAYETCETLGDVWGAAQSSQMIAQLCSQSDDPEGAVLWTERARTGMRLVGAPQEERQLDWHLGMAKAKRGELDEAEQIFLALFANEDENETPFGDIDAFNSRSLGLTGRAEIAALRGDADTALALGRDAAMIQRHLNQRGEQPWYLFTAAGMLAIATDFDRCDEVADIAHVLRVRMIVNARRSQGLSMLDRPVFGAALVGFGTWVTAFGGTPSDVGLELLTLGVALHGRQDQPSLVHQHRLEVARRSHGDAVDKALKAATSLPDPVTRLAQATTLLRALKLPR